MQSFHPFKVSMFEANHFRPASKPYYACKVVIINDVT